MLEKLPARHRPLINIEASDISVCVNHTATSSAEKLTSSSSFSSGMRYPSDCASANSSSEFLVTIDSDESDEETTVRRTPQHDSSGRVLRLVLSYNYNMMVTDILGSLVNNGVESSVFNVELLLEIFSTARKLHASVGKRAFMTSALIPFHRALVTIFGPPQLNYCNLRPLLNTPFWHQLVLKIAFLQMIGEKVSFFSHLESKSENSLFVFGGT